MHDEREMSDEVESGVSKYKSSSETGSDDIGASLQKKTNKKGKSKKSVDNSSVSTSEKVENNKNKQSGLTGESTVMNNGKSARNGGSKNVRTDKSENLGEISDTVEKLATPSEGETQNTSGKKGKRSSKGNSKRSTMPKTSKKRSKSVNEHFSSNSRKKKDKESIEPPLPTSVVPSSEQMESDSDDSGNLVIDIP